LEHFYDLRDVDSYGKQNAAPWLLAFVKEWTVSLSPLLIYSGSLFCVFIHTDNSVCSLKFCFIYL